jgi:MHS family proline/betaine transporter-like MFS transporter
MVAVAHRGVEPPASGARQAVVAAVIGNVLEWYDFSVYAFVAVIIAKKFFPAGNDSSALLATFAAFGIGFLARPLGGIVIGRIGDTRGRKAALVLTILLMAIGTTVIGLIPSYDTIGLAAPALLVLARLMQGFSAGGEWGGSTAFIVEWAPGGRRGYYGSFQQASVASGLLLGSAIALLMNTTFGAAAMEDWGWRVPFLLGAILGPVGIYLRRNIDETPAYRRVSAAPAAAPTMSPVGLAALAFGFTIHWTVVFYIFLSYMPTFTAKYLKLQPAEALWSNTIGLLVLVLAIPAFGRLSDRIGRKPLLLTSCAAFILLGVACILLPYPLLTQLIAGVSFQTLIVIQIVFGLCIALYSGAGPAAISEIFPTRIRSTWMTTGYALSVAIFGGFAPFIATWLIDRTGLPIAPVFYVLAASVITALVLLLGVKETAHGDLA